MDIQQTITDMGKSIIPEGDGIRTELTDDGRLRLRHELLAGTHHDDPGVPDAITPQGTLSANAVTE